MKAVAAIPVRTIQPTAKKINPETNLNTKVFQPEEKKKLSDSMDTNIKPEQIENIINKSEESISMLKTVNSQKLKNPSSVKLLNSFLSF